MSNNLGKEASENSTTQNQETFGSIMSSPKKFASDIIWFGIAELFNAIILGIMILPVLTKFYTSELYGIWIQVNMTMFLLSSLIGLQLRLAVVRFLSAEEDRERRRYFLGSMLFAIIIFSCMVLVIIVMLSEQFSFVVFGGTQFTNFIYLTILWIFFNSLYNFFSSYLRARQMIRRISVILVVFSTFKMITIIILTNTGFGLEWIIVSQIALQAAVAFISLVMIIRDIGFLVPNLRGLRGFLAFSVPQIPAAILIYILIVIDRYFITHFLGLSQTGIYSSSSTLAGLMALFHMPISFVLFPVVSRLWLQKRFEDVKSYVEYSIRLFLTLAIPAAVALAILSQPLLSILTTSEYLAGLELVLVLSLGTIFFGLYLLNVDIILLVKQAKFRPFVIAAATSINIIMNIMLIPQIGIMGAGISNLASHFVLAVIVTIWARKIFTYDLDFKYLGKVMVAVLVMALCVYFIEANDVLGIITAVIIGLSIFGGTLFLMRAFTRQDRSLIRKVFQGLMPWLNK